MDIERFLEAQRLKGVSDETLRAYASDLKLYDEWYQWLYTGYTRMNDHMVVKYLNTHVQGWAPKTTARKLATFRAYVFFHRSEHLLPDYKLPKPARAMAHPLPGGNADVDAMIAVAHHHHHRALLVLCGKLGLRVGEARTVKPSDYSADDSVLKVWGKGNKVRVVPIPEGLWSLIEPAYTIAQCNGDSPIVPLSDRGARAIVTELGRRACISRPVATHDLRMTTGTEVMNRTNNIRVVQEILGHADLSTTQVYTGVTIEQMREALRKDS